MLIEKKEEKKLKEDIVFAQSLTKLSGLNKVKLLIADNQANTGLTCNPPNQLSQGLL